MSEYNLTQRERQILVRVLDVSRHSKEHFEARIVDPSATGSGRELSRLDFGGAGDSMELARRALRELQDEGLIHFAGPPPPAERAGWRRHRLSRRRSASPASGWPPGSWSFPSGRNGT